MKTYVALLRGINVGGKNSLPMRVLISILENSGAQNVRTYIQSGNAVFQSAETPPHHLAKELSDKIEICCGFKPFILVLDSDAFDRAMANNPFPEAATDPGSLHLGFLASIPQNPDMKKLTSLRAESEHFQLIDTVFYLHAPEGVGRSKLAVSSEKLLGVQMTDRNWKTVCKIREMVCG